MAAFFKRSLIALFVGFVLSIALGEIFFKISSRPVFDQISFLLVTTAACGTIAYFILEASVHRPALLKMQNPAISFAGLAQYLRENAIGLGLAVLFFLIYTSIGLKLNRSSVDSIDNYLDADNSTWMARIAAPGGSSLEMRGPHPFAYFILRPPGWLFMLLADDFALASNLLNTLVGGICVLLSWFFFKRLYGDPLYSFLVSALLGLSTSHLFFGSVVESYIFSAAALIGFTLLVQSGGASIFVLIASSLLTFGITLTNFAQNLILFIVSRPRWREFIRFSGWAISLGVLLSLAHAAWFPSAKLFYLPSDARAEEEFSLSIFDQPAWRAFGRILLLIRTQLLYTIMAPRPYVFGEEVGGTFPRFNFFKIVPGTFSLSAYDGMGNVLVGFWAIILLVAGVLFLRDLIRTRSLDLRMGFVLCLTFNFVLHLSYGYEPFLYSPDWAYALVFFVGMSLAPLRTNRLFLGIFLVFLVMLALNQYGFFKFIFLTIAPFVNP